MGSKDQWYQAGTWIATALLVIMIYISSGASAPEEQDKTMASLHKIFDNITDMLTP